MTSAQPTSRKPTRWRCDHTNHVIMNTIGVVSTAKQHQTRHTNTRATGVQKLTDRNRERGLTSHSNRGAAHKLTPHTRECIKHTHVCTESSDNSERLQCRRAYRVLSARFGHGIGFGSVVCATIQNLHTHCTLLFSTSTSVQQPLPHTCIQSDMNVAVDNLMHIARTKRNTWCCMVARSHPHTKTQLARFTHKLAHTQH
jgi:hypothetical protein